MRVVLKEFTRVKKRLASGSIRIYYYAWRGGPQLAATPRTPEFIAQYNEAHASLRQPRHGTVMTIIAAFKASAEYDRLSRSSKRAYMSYLKLIENEFGDLPLAALADRRVRGDFKTWRERLYRGDTPQSGLRVDNSGARDVVRKRSRPHQH